MHTLRLPFSSLVVRRRAGAAAPLVAAYDSVYCACHRVERQLELHSEDKPEPRLGWALDLSNRRLAKMRCGTGTTKMCERQFGKVRYAHDQAPTLLEPHLSGRSRGSTDQPNHWLWDMYREHKMSRRSIDAYAAFHAAEAARRASVHGGRRGEAIRRGRVRRERMEATFAEARRNEEEMAAKRAQYARDRVSKLSELENLSRDELLDQIRGFKLINNATLVLSKHSSTLSRVEALFSLFKQYMPKEACDRNADQIAKMAKRRPSRAGGRQRRGKGKSKKDEQDKEWPVQAIVGAKMGPVCR